ncbi:glycosyltransferase [Methanogenium sp. MK-MG]|uniref:glycosyltransferase n=1 Tax=Methanogenium sp. MK-MG TaxID=2599926 RepID=UPI0013EA5E75|nr:glycosyltransferase [Methanogenium sp. MK-MG]KAF1079008.1 D-inositol-3-phosphate glycosyltransferase [Methanogenium sp. MK-MG]
MIKVLMCGPDASSGGVTTHTKRLTEELEELGVVIISHSFSGSNFRKLYQRTIGLMLKAINKRTEYDIIHIQASGGIFSFISAITGAIASHGLNKRLIVTFHNSETKRFVTVHKHAFGFVLNKLDKLILVSHKQEEAVISLYGDISEKIIVLPNGFKDSLYYAMDKVACRNMLNLPLDKKIIFNISNLIESKGHKFLISSIREMISVNNNCSCYIAGKGYFENTLKDQVSELQLQNYVTFLGWIPDEQIPIWINACDIFVLPSLAEGNPIVMFEALGCGKPFVGTIIGGIPEIINSNEYGLLVEPADYKDLSEKILIALDKEWDRDVILSYAEQFKWKNIAKETKRVYVQHLI